MNSASEGPDIRPEREATSLDEFLSFLCDNLDSLIDNVTTLQHYVDNLRPGLESFATAHLLRQCALTGESVCHLVRVRRGETANIVSRTCVESCISLAFMMNKATTERCRYYIYSLHRFIRDSHAIANSANQVSASNQLILGSLRVVPKHTKVDLKQQDERFQRFLTDNNLGDVHQLWEQIRPEYEKNNRYPQWFALNGGPKSMWRVAEEVGAQDLYQWVYKPLNADVHGHTPKGMLGDRIGPIPSPLYSDDAAIVAGNALYVASIAALRSKTIDPLLVARHEIERGPHVRDALRRLNSAKMKMNL